MVAETGRFHTSIVLGGLIVLLAFSPPRAHAQGVGFHGGATIDPEQFFVGSHFETPELVPRLHVRPGVDGAFGSGVTIASIDIDFLYKYDIGPNWNIYQGGGPAIHVLRAGDPPENDVTGGLTGIFGFGHASGFFAEFRVAAAGANLKLGIGFTLRR